MYIRRVELTDTSQLFDRQFVRRMLLPVVLAVIAYAALLMYGDAHEIGRGLTRLPVSVLLVGCGLSLASFALRGVRWHYYLRVMGLRVPFGVASLAFLVGLGMSITPGKVGELLKALLLKEACDVPVARSAPIVVAERVMDLGALVTLGGAGLAWSTSPILAALIIAGGFVCFFVFGKMQWPALVVLKLAARIPMVARYREKLLTAHRSLFELWGFGTYSVSMLLSLLAWGLQAWIIVVFAGELPHTTVTLAHALVSYSAPLLAGTLALLPGGLGLTEASMTGTLHALSGVAPPLAALLTILIRGVTFWLAVLLGFVALFAWRASRREPARAKN